MTSDELFWRYWGKADPALGGHHLAAFHCLDVAAVAEVMVERNAVLRGRLARWLGLPDGTVAPTMAAIIALHDIGKFDVRFQMKCRAEAEALDPSRRTCPEWRGFDHGRWGFSQLRALAKASPSSFGFLRSASGLELLFNAVCAHHGALFSPETPIPPHPDVPGTAMRLDRAARAAFVAAVTSLYEELGAVAPTIEDPTFAAIEALAGLCGVSDWLGSYVRDEHAGVDYFTYEHRPRSLAEYRERALAIARRLLDDLPMFSAGAGATGFADLFPFEPRGIQKTIEACDLPQGPSLVVLEAPMGEGKTEAALALVARWMHRGDATGVYFALPTMATANGMFARMDSAAARLFTGTVNLRLAHGRALGNDAFRRLTRRSLRGRLGAASGTDETPAEVVSARWFLSRKRALLGQAAVGTVDQAMQSVVRLRHNFVRLYGLSTQVVVVDELHAYDAYMEVILERLVEWLGALGTPVVLLSATLPAVRREAFSRAYARGAGWAEPPNRSTSLAYPLATVRCADGIETHSGEAGSSRSVVIEAVDTAEPSQTLAARLVAAAKNGALVAWIRNTVAEAQHAWEAVRALADDVPCTLFHARLRPVDRARVERDVLRRFGRQGERTHGEVLIATQVVEQSLDLDFDLLASDLCPIDLLLQRSGRLWRHARPERVSRTGVERPTMLVVQPPPDERAALRFDRSAKVYDPVSLWLSQDSLVRRGAIAIPDELRSLVEDTYDPERRARRIADAPNREALEAAEASLRRELEVRRAKADEACIPPASRDAQTVFGLWRDDEEAAAALTRDGSSTSLLLVHWDGDTARSLDGEEWELDASQPNAWRTLDALQDEVVQIPSYPWERIEEGVTPWGEPILWEQWCARCRAFLDEVGMGREWVLVPMRTRDHRTFRGRVRTSKGEHEWLHYERERGLWFPERAAPKWA